MLRHQLTPRATFPCPCKSGASLQSSRVRNKTVIRMDRAFPQCQNGNWVTLNSAYKGKKRLKGTLSLNFTFILLPHELWPLNTSAQAVFSSFITYTPFPSCLSLWPGLSLQLIDLISLISVKISQASQAGEEGHRAPCTPGLWGEVALSPS